MLLWYTVKLRDECLNVCTWVVEVLKYSSELFVFCIAITTLQFTAKLCVCFLLHYLYLARVTCYMWYNASIIKRCLVHKISLLSDHVSMSFNPYWVVYFQCIFNTFTNILFHLLSGQNNVCAQLNSTLRHACTTDHLWYHKYIGKQSQDNE